LLCRARLQIANSFTADLPAKTEFQFDNAPRK
jgi:hypothetical protein